MRKNELQSVARDALPRALSLSALLPLMDRPREKSSVLFLPCQAVSSPDTIAYALKSERPRTPSRSPRRRIEDFLLRTVVDVAIDVSLAICKAVRKVGAAGGSEHL